MQFVRESTECQEGLLEEHDEPYLRHFRQATELSGERADQGSSDTRRTLKKLLQSSPYLTSHCPAEICIEGGTVPRETTLASDTCAVIIVRVRQVETKSGKIHIAS